MAIVERRTPDELAADRLRDDADELADGGWDVVEYHGDERRVLDWFADRHAAAELAAQINDE